MGEEFCPTLEWHELAAVVGPEEERDLDSYGEVMQEDLIGDAGAVMSDASAGSHISANTSSSGVSNASASSSSSDSSSVSEYMGPPSDSYLARDIRKTKENVIGAQQEAEAEADLVHNGVLPPLDSELPLGSDIILPCAGCNVNRTAQSGGYQLVCCVVCEKKWHIKINCANPQPNTAQVRGTYDYKCSVCRGQAVPQTMGRSRRPPSAALPK